MPPPDARAPATARRPRRHAAAARLVQGFGIPLVLFLAAWLALGLGGPQRAGLVADLAQFGSIGLMGAMAGLAARDTHGRTRRGWALLAATAASWFLAQSIWVLATHLDAPLPAPLHDVVMPLAYLLGTPLMVLAASNLFSPSLTATARVRRLLDAACVVGSVVVVLWLLYVDRAFAALPDHHVLTLAYLVTYPVGDAILLAVMVMRFPRLPRAWRRTLWPLPLGFASIIAADLSYAVTQTQGYYEASSKFVLGWVAGEVLLASAALRSIAVAPVSTSAAPNPTTYGKGALVAPGVMGLAVLVQYAGAAQLDAFTVYGSLAVLALLLARGWLHIVEMQQGADVLTRALEAERTLREQRGELERMQHLNASKTQLLNLVAHELNTPIAAVDLQVRVLRNRFGPSMTDEAKDAMDLLDRNVERLAGLVSDTLDVARLQSGHLDLQVAPTRIAPLVAETVATFSEMTRERDLRIVTDVPQDLQARIDARRFMQVLYNLVSNAIKFTPVEGRVLVSARVERGDLVLDVQDTGIGMTPGQLSRLFQPFTQVHDGAPGTGLGLYISRGIIEQHGGHLDASSPGPAQGARFRIQLPLGSAAPS